MQLFLNNWSTTLTAPLSDADASLEVPADAAAALGVIGAGDYYLLTLALVDSLGKETAWEIVQATGVAGTSVAVTRGSPARNWEAGAEISLRFTAEAARKLGEHETALDPHPQYTTQAEAEAAAAAAVDGHVTAPNPHPQYVSADALAAAALATGDVLVTLREPATGYAPAGTVQLQAAYPELFDLVGLLDGTPPSAATWGHKVVDDSERDHYWMASDGWSVFIVGAGAGRILRSDDAGATWSVVTITGAGHFYCFDTDGDGIWLASEQGTNFLWRSTDEGLTWAKVITPSVRALCLAMAPNGVCLAGGASGNMLRSTDHGATWATVTTGFATTTIYGMATDGAGKWILVGNFGKTSYSTDDGATFTLTPSSPFGTTNLGKIASNKAGTWIAASDQAAKVGVSTDNGATWTIMTSGVDSFSTVAHVTGSEWVAFGYSGYRTWRTLDNGATWTQGTINNGMQVNRVAKGQGGGGKIYAAYGYGNFILEPVGSYPYDPATQFKVPAYAAPEGFKAFIKA